MKFKVGDKVKIQTDPDDSVLSDLEADLLSDIAEGDISGATYDRIWNILEKVADGDSPIFVITQVKSASEDEDEDEDVYALKCGRTSMRYMWAERHLVGVV